MQNYPSNKQEIQQLIKWFNDNMMAVQGDGAKTEDVIKTTLLETIKQVYVNSVDRGNLLLNCIDQFFGIQDGKVKASSNELKDMREQFERMFDKSRVVFDKTIEKCLQESIELTMKNNSLKEQLESSEERVRLKDDIIARLNNKSSYFQASAVKFKESMIKYYKLVEELKFMIRSEKKWSKHDVEEEIKQFKNNARTKRSNTLVNIPTIDDMKDNEEAISEDRVLEGTDNSDADEDDVIDFESKRAKDAEVRIMKEIFGGKEAGELNLEVYEGTGLTSEMRRFDKETQTPLPDTFTRGVQTTFSLVPQKFDCLFESPQAIEELAREVDFKKKLLVQFAESGLTEEDFDSADRQEQIYERMKKIVNEAGFGETELKQLDFASKKPLNSFSSMENVHHEGVLSPRSEYSNIPFRAQSHQFDTIPPANFNKVDEDLIDNGNLLNLPKGQQGRFSPQLSLSGVDELEGESSIAKNHNLPNQDFSDHYHYAGSDHHQLDSHPGSPRTKKVGEKAGFKLQINFTDPESAIASDPPAPTKDILAIDSPIQMSPVSLPRPSMPARLVSPGDILNIQDSPIPKEFTHEDSPKLIPDPYALSPETKNNFYRPSLQFGTLNTLLPPKPGQQYPQKNRTLAQSPLSLLQQLTFEMNKAYVLNSRLRRAKAEVDLKSKEAADLADELYRSKEASERKNNEILELQLQISKLKEKAKHGRQGSESDNGSAADSEMSADNQLSINGGEADRKKHKLGKKKTTQFIQTQMFKHNQEHRALAQNHAKELITLLNKGRFGNFKNPMALKTIMRTINTLYTDRIKELAARPETRLLPFADYVYLYYMQVFGIKNIAERKFTFFILSLKYFGNYFRVNMFSRFLGLVESKTYDEELILKYLEGVELMDKGLKGFAIKNKDTAVKVLYPYLRTEEVLRHIFDEKLSGKEMSELKTAVEKLKEADPTGMNSAVIDIDFFLEKVLDKYTVIVNRNKQYVLDAFKACDLDGNNTCTVNEFLLLNRYIEPKTYDLHTCVKWFFDSADIILGKEQAMSFDRFAVVSTNMNLFSEKAQHEFLSITELDQLHAMFKSLREDWPKKKLALLAQLKSFCSITEEEMSNWKSVIDGLDQKILSFPSSYKELKPLLIAYKMTTLEFNRIEAEDEPEARNDDNDLTRIVNNRRSIRKSEMIDAENLLQGLGGARTPRATNTSSYFDKSAKRRSSIVK